MKEKRAISYKQSLAFQCAVSHILVLKYISECEGAPSRQARAALKSLANAIKIAEGK